jgi:hypothetical protein
MFNPGYGPGRRWLILTVRMRLKSRITEGGREKEGERYT